MTPVVKSGKHLVDNIPIQSVQKQEDSSMPLLFNFASEYNTPLGRFKETRWD
jgi:hypothetical protein